MGYGESDDKADGVSVKPPNAEQLSNSGGSDDDSSPLEDVTICDICGDAGREDLLVVCSKCSDGAEHTYCMRTRLDEVPEEWICEDCLRLKDDDKRSQTEVEKSDASTEGSISKEPPQDAYMTGQSVVKAYPIMGPKRLGASINVGDKESSSPPPEASLGVVDPALSKRKRTPGEENASPRPSKTLRRQDSAMKQNSDLFTMDSGPSRRTSQNGSLPPVSGQDSSKSSRLLTQSGALTKSKSFSIWDKKPKTRLLEKTPLIQTKKASGTRSLRKSVSFGDSAASDKSVPDARTSVAPLKKVSELNDLKRSRSMKSSDSLEKAIKPEFGKPSQIIPLEGRPPVTITSFDKKLASFREIGSIHGNKLSDQRSHGNTKESGTDNASELKKISSPSKSLEHLTSPCVVQDKVPAPEKQQSTKTHDFIRSGTATSDERSGTYSSQKVAPDNSTICQAKDISAGPVLDLGRAKHMVNSSVIDPIVPFDHLNRPFAVPMFDYIWKGEFVVKSSGSRLPRLSYKIQAYLSTLSSLRIPEIVKEFADKITLDEVSRPSTWPKKFLEQHQPRDESIGLYFFAEDIHSYPNYKSLLRCMIDYDLALKGNFNGIELLIFSSNLLPENSQRWNNMLFLWGTFRQRNFTSA